MNPNLENPTSLKKFSLGIIAFFSFIGTLYYIKAWYPTLLGFFGDWKYVLIFYILAILAFGTAYYLFFTYHLKISKRNNLKDSKSVNNSFNKYSYDRNDCIKFYDAIADVYDLDNSKEIWFTHRAIAKIIFLFASKKDKTSILDIGGGTGTLLFDVLSLNEKLKWTYVDNSRKMYEIFKSKCEEQQLNVNMINDSFDVVLSQLKKDYDIIVLSFFFSSLPSLPDLTRISNLLKDGGIIIFADADREYAKRLPYTVLNNNSEYTLLTKPWKLSEINNAFMKIGFKLIGQKLIDKNSEVYSHIITYQK